LKQFRVTVFVRAHYGAYSRRERHVSQIGEKKRAAFLSEGKENKFFSVKGHI
jgi:hypothetical protein